MIKRGVVASGGVLLAIGMALSTSSVGAQDATTKPALWITADRMLDVRSGRLVERPHLLVREGRIVEVGSGDATLPAGATHVDLKGMTLLPGLIDMHVHLDSDPTYGGYTSLQFTDRFWSVLAVGHAQKTLMAGFTTVRNVGADDWNDVGLRQAIDAGKLTGPRIVTGGPSFGATGGHCDSTFFPPSMEQKSPYNADSPEEGRKRVRELRKYGAQVIKICATGGVFSRNTEPGQQQLSLAEMQAIVQEAHQWGLKVAAHDARTRDGDFRQRVFFSSETGGHEGRAGDGCYGKCCRCDSGCDDTHGCSSCRWAAPCLDARLTGER